MLAEVFERDILTDIERTYELERGRGIHVCMYVRTYRWIDGWWEGVNERREEREEYREGGGLQNFGWELSRREVMGRGFGQEVAG